MSIQLQAEKKILRLVGGVDPEPLVVFYDGEACWLSNVREAVVRPQWGHNSRSVWTGQHRDGKTYYFVAVHEKVLQVLQVYMWSKVLSRPWFSWIYNEQRMHFRVEIRKL